MRVARWRRAALGWLVLAGVGVGVYVALSAPPVPLSPEPPEQPPGPAVARGPAPVPAASPPRARPPGEEPMRAAKASSVKAPAVKPAPAPTGRPSPIEAWPDPAEPEPDGADPVTVSAWPLSADGIRGAVAEVSPMIQRCYESALGSAPGLEGALTVSFVIEERDGVGDITEAWLSNRQLGDPAVHDCVLDAMSALQFDAPADGRTQVTYPLVFSAR